MVKVTQHGNSGPRRPGSTQPGSPAHRISPTAPTALTSRRRPWARIPRPARRREAPALAALAWAAIRPYQPRYGAADPLSGFDFERLCGERSVHVLDDEAAEPDADGPSSGSADRGGIGAPVALMVAVPMDRALVIPLIAIRPDRRDLGLDAALIAYGEALARLSGLVRVDITIAECRWEENAHLARLGYEPVDRREDDGVVSIVRRKSIG